MLKDISESIRMLFLFGRPYESEKPTTTIQTTFPQSFHTLGIFHSMNIGMQQFPTGIFVQWMLFALLLGIPFILPVGDAADVQASEANIISQGNYLFQLKIVISIQQSIQFCPLSCYCNC